MWPLGGCRKGCPVDPRQVRSWGRAVVLLWVVAGGPAGLPLYNWAALWLHGEKEKTNQKHWLALGLVHHGTCSNEHVLVMHIHMNVSAQTRHAQACRKNSCQKPVSLHLTRGVRQEFRGHRGVQRRSERNFKVTGESQEALVASFAIFNLQSSNHNYKTRLN